MCLIALAWRCHPRYAMVFAGNRDEFYERPTAPAAWWPAPAAGVPRLLAGRDLAAGGTWLGVSEDGRFATVTNVREPGARRRGARSRGELVTGLLQGGAPGHPPPDEAPPPRTPAAALAELRARGEDFAHFNLLFGDFGERGALAYVNNVDGVPPRDLPAGLHVLSNHRLDTPWPKAVRVRDGLAALLARHGSGADETRLIDALLELFADPTPAAEEALPATGLPRERERALSAPFIRTDDYGTRATTIVLAAMDGRVRFVEQSYAAGGIADGRVDRSFTAADGG